MRPVATRRAERVCAERKPIVGQERFGLVVGHRRPLEFEEDDPRFAIAVDSSSTRCINAPRSASVVSTVNRKPAYEPARPRWSWSSATCPMSAASPAASSFAIGAACRFDIAGEGVRGGEVRVHITVAEQRFEVPRHIGGGQIGVSHSHARRLCGGPRRGIRSAPGWPDASTRPHRHRARHRIDPRRLFQREATGIQDAVTVGAAGIGDAYFPDSGNGGYDVLHYDDSHRLHAHRPADPGNDHDRERGRPEPRCLRPRLLRPSIDAISVGGKSATFSRSGHELTVRPRSPVAEGQQFTTRVRYHGVPHPVADPSGLRRPRPRPLGWIRSDNGDVFVVSEPIGARTWFPSNDHPADKATFDVTVNVPDAFAVASNGALTEGPVRRTGATGTGRCIVRWPPTSRRS